MPNSHAKCSYLTIVALFFGLSGLVGCDNVFDNPVDGLDDPVVGKLSSASEAVGVEGYTNIHVDQDSSMVVVRATLLHGDTEYNHAEISVVRNDKSGIWHLALKRANGERIKIKWDSESGAVTATGPEGVGSVEAIRSYASPAEYEKASHALKMYIKEIELISLMYEDLMVREEMHPSMPPMDAFDPNYLSPDEADRLEREIQRQRAATGSAYKAQSQAPQSNIRLAGLVFGGGRCSMPTVGIASPPIPCGGPGEPPCCGGYMFSVTASGLSRIRACFDATNELNFRCSNRGCFGCKIIFGCDCFCAGGDYLCACTAHGMSCFYPCY